MISAASRIVWDGREEEREKRQKMMREVRREYAINGRSGRFLGFRLQIFYMNEGERILAGKKNETWRHGIC